MNYLFGLDRDNETFYYYQPPLSTGAAFTGSVQNPTRDVTRFNNDLTLTHEYDLTLRCTPPPRSAAGRRPTTATRCGGGQRSLAGTDDGRLGRRDADVEPVHQRHAHAWRLPAGAPRLRRAAVHHRWPELRGVERLRARPAVAALPAPRRVVERGQGAVLREHLPRRALNTLRLRAAYGETGGQPPSAYSIFDNYSRRRRVPASRRSSPARSPETRNSSRSASASTRRASMRHSRTTARRSSSPGTTSTRRTSCSTRRCPSARATAASCRTSAR